MWFPSSWRGGFKTSMCWRGLSVMSSCTEFASYSKWCCIQQVWASTRVHSLSWWTLPRKPSSDFLGTLAPFIEESMWRTSPSSGETWIGLSSLITRPTPICFNLKMRFKWLHDSMIWMTRSWWTWFQCWRKLQNKKMWFSLWKIYSGHPQLQ